MTYDLPKTIVLKDKAKTKLTKRISCDGAADQRRITDSITIIGGKYRCVEVLARNLRGKEDLHGKPYQPTTWIFTNVDVT